MMYVMPVVSCYKNTFAASPLGTYRFNVILEAVRNGRWAHLIHAINRKVRPAKKEELPCFTVSGRFGAKTQNGCLDYNGLIHLDYDKVKDLEGLKANVLRSPYTFACFVSPSGTGLKVFVRTDVSRQDHKAGWFQVDSYYRNLTGLDGDPVCKNLNRLCYISFDPAAVLNLQSRLFRFVPVTVQKPAPSLLRKPLSASGVDVEAFLYDFTADKIGQYQVGNRNIFIYTFCRNANRYGVSEFEGAKMAEDIWLRDNAGFPRFRLLRTVKSAYSNKHEFSKYSLPKKIQQ